MLALENSDSQFFFLQKGLGPLLSSFLAGKNSIVGPLISDRPVRLFKVTLTLWFLLALWFLKLALWLLRLALWLFTAFGAKHRAYKELLETK